MNINKLPPPPPSPLPFDVVQPTKYVHNTTLGVGVGVEKETAPEERMKEGGGGAEGESITK